MSGVQLLMYIGLISFIVGSAYKAIKMARMPLHLRWDLYPIPHERGKSHYGGSYYEETDWWTKPANVSISSEIKEMAKEILFIQSMYHNNRPLWIFSFPFHFGLYLSIVFVLLIYAGSILGLLDFSIAANSGSIIGIIVYDLTLLFGVAGTVLGGLGAIGLFFSRIFTEVLRKTSVFTDYMNLILLAGVFVTGFWAWATIDSGYEGTRAFISSFITFSNAAAMPTLVTVHFYLAALFLLWLPFTHMTHFIGKYFTYHKVRWEDHPNIKGSALEKTVVNTLGYNISWSAPHIKSGGTWAEAATAGSNEEGDTNE